MKLAWACVATLCVGVLECAPAVTQPAAPVPEPFTARYDAQWKSINVGSSDIALKAGTEAGRYEYKWTITARGIFKVVYDKPVTQTSWFDVLDGHARPLRYLGEEGSSSVSLNFDWNKKTITGLSEGKPVNIAIKNSAQDLNSIQVEIMLDLQRGELPKAFEIIDKDQLKEFNYTREPGTVRIRTAMGEMETVVVASQRTGNTRILRMWFAPSLGYMPVQAERTRDGKLEFAMRLKSFSR
jgi:Protein of unknown function (DUF3108)